MNARPPAIVSWLGYGGLLPFVMLSALAALQPARAELWHNLLLTYSAIILSFVGAQHWAFAMFLPAHCTSKRAGYFVWSVVPAVMAWVALSAPQVLEALRLTPLRFVSLLIIAIGFLAHLIQDWRIAQAIALPAWYLPLRARLSAVVFICLVAMAAVRLHS